MTTPMRPGVVRAADPIRDAILRGELAPGMQLRQVELAERLRLSRVTVREALNVLATEGLLQHRPHSGYYVRALSREEVSQIYLMLDLLEEVVLRGITGGSPDQLRELSDKNAEMADAFRRSAVHDLMEVNREFHFGVLRLGGKPVILQEIFRLWTMSESYRVLHLRDYLGHAETLEQHRQMVDAIKNGDTKTLVRLSKAHRRASKTSVLEVLKMRDLGRRGI